MVEPRWSAAREKKVGRGQTQKAGGGDGKLGTPAAMMKSAAAAGPAPGEDRAERPRPRLAATMPGKLRARREGWWGTQSTDCGCPLQKLDGSREDCISPLLLRLVSPSKWSPSSCRLPVIGALFGCYSQARCCVKLRASRIVDDAAAAWIQLRDWVIPRRGGVAVGRGKAAQSFLVEPRTTRQGHRGEQGGNLWPLRPKHLLPKQR